MNLTQRRKDAKKKLSTYDASRAAPGSSLITHHFSLVTHHSSLPQYPTAAPSFRESLAPRRMPVFSSIMMPCASPM
ncbi:MAG: hypothetical protein QOD32_1144 [Pyrinomonadaceae bacterium]|nr:hypothetical protein [Pyrinomonadaceae bacterium]